jgi:hypothetical protein
LTLNRLVLGLVFLVGVAASRAQAQDARLAARFPAAALPRLGGPIDSAGVEGLPTEPLVLRALEGQAKKASLDQIVTALDRLRSALRTAKVTLGSNADAVELTTAAAALQAGVPEARLAELHRLRGTLPLTAPLGAYLDLIARGAEADRAWDRIADLARRRAADADFVRLTPADVEHDPAPGTLGTP